MFNNERHAETSKLYNNVMFFKYALCNYQLHLSIMHKNVKNILGKFKKHCLLYFPI